MSTTIEWLGHDSFRLSDDATVYIDPWKLQDGPPADLILITHEHYDHCSPEDVGKVLGPRTVILGNAASINLCKEAGIQAEMRAVKAGDSVEAAGVRVAVVPAYNLNKFRSPGVVYHPKASGHNGYLITVGEEVIYHTGDTDFIPEMQGIQCDILLIPVSGTYVMTAEEAAQACRQIKPRGFAIPMHYGEIVGSEGDAQRFKDLYGGEVRIMHRVR
jgi:L-ascorbate metabolism protein UlaG (beta-lactamase superfamily)